MEIIKVSDYEELSRIAARLIIRKVNESRTCNFGLATGSTPVGLYRYLVEDHPH